MTDSGLRQQPHNLDSEKAVLGAIMIDNSTLVVAQQILTPESFYDAGHNAIFAAMLGLSDRGAPIDPTTVCEELFCKDSLEVAGGAVGVEDLEVAVLSTKNIRSHANIVKEKAERRLLIRAAASIADLAFDVGVPNDELALASDKAVYDVLCSMRPKSCMQAMDTLTQEMVERIEDIRSRNISTPGLALKWPQVSSFFRGGIQNTDSVIIAARTSVGKTAMALNITTDLAIRQRRRVLFFSLEMDRRQLWNRIAAQTLKIRAGDLQEPTELSQADFDNLCGPGQHTLGTGALMIDDTGGLDIGVLRARAREAHMIEPLSMIVVDYMQLVRDSGVGSRATRQEEVASVSKHLKALAKELFVPILSLCQLSRNVEQRRGKNAVPVLSDLRESGAIEQDADVVMMIHRPQMYQPGESGATTLFVRKNRNGPTGEVPMYFDPILQRFRELGSGDDDDDDDEDGDDAMPFD